MVELKQFYQGNMCNAYEYFGAHIVEKGVVFRTYAPHAQSIHVIGDFNNWKADDSSLMKRHNDRGEFELWVANAKKGDRYKFRIRQAIGNVVDKSDPYAFRTELRPNTASIVEEIHDPVFTDEEWMKTRTRNFDTPMNIYEVHLGAWKLPEQEKDAQGKEIKKWYRYEEIADDLVAYCKKMHYTHVEFMPLSEYPFDGS
ncbi:MAG: 1,4-alpha-glucan branching enzyme, partial [Traorella sp.]